MVIEVVVRKVREDTGGEGAVRDPLLFEGMGRYLHHAVGDAFVGHLLQYPVEVGRLRGRMRRFEYTPVVTVVDRAYNAGREPRLPEYRFKQVGRGRLAVRAGHAHERHPPGGRAVEGIRYL